jgi:hypothetical protein
MGAMVHVGSVKKEKEKEKGSVVNLGRESTCRR